MFQKHFYRYRIRIGTVWYRQAAVSTSSRRRPGLIQLDVNIEHLSIRPRVLRNKGMGARRLSVYSMDVFSTTRLAMSNQYR